MIDVGLEVNIIAQMSNELERISDITTQLRIISYLQARYTHKLHEPKGVTYVESYTVADNTNS